MESESEPIDGSEYYTPNRHQQGDAPRHRIPGSMSLPSETSVLSGEPILCHQSSPPTAEAISLQDMRELIRSHEEDIVNQVGSLLQRQPSSLTLNREHNQQHFTDPSREKLQTDPIRLQIAEIEAQLSQPRGEREPRPRPAQASRKLST